MGRRLPGFGGKFACSSVCDSKAQRVSTVHFLGGVQEAVSQEKSPQQLDPRLEEGVGSHQIRVIQKRKLKDPGSKFWAARDRWNRKGRSMSQLRNEESAMVVLQVRRQGDIRGREGEGQIIPF